MLLLHSGCITPLTHRQTHLAFVLVALTDAPINTAHSNNFRLAPPLSLRRFLHPFDVSAIRHILDHRCVLPAPARRGHHRDRISSMMRRLPDAFNISLRTGASATGPRSFPQSTCRADTNFLWITKSPALTRGGDGHSMSLVLETPCGGHRPREIGGFLSSDVELDPTPLCREAKKTAQGRHLAG